MAERVSTPAQERAWAAMRAHRHWAYRACAPSPDVAGMAAADDTVAVTAWLSQDGEQQKARLVREEAATALCGRCPVRTMCLDYALGDEAGPYEPWDIWGGMTAHQRAGLLKERRRLVAIAAAPAAAEPPAVTELDLVVLRALAAHRTEQAVAAAAGMTVTRANWHRTRLVTALHLNERTTTRMRLLYAARLAAVLDPRTVILGDRDRVIAAVPRRQGAVVRARGVQLVIPGLPDFARCRPAVARLRLVPGSPVGYGDPCLEMVA